MAHTIISLNPDEDREARELLRLVCSGTDVEVSEANKDAVDRLVRLDMAAFVRGTSRIGPTEKGRRENSARVLSAGSSNG